MVVKAVVVSIAEIEELIAEIERFDVGGGESTAALVEVMRRKAYRRMGRKWRCMLSRGVDVGWLVGW